MDSSQITKLLQKQHTRTLHRTSTVDSSTLTWRQQLQSSTYVHGPHQATPTTTSTSCCFGGQGKQTTLQTGSSQMVLNPLSAATGSGSEVYSADRLLLQRAGRHACAIRADLGATPVSLELPACFCENTNVPSTHSQTNPYLPPFDTYYQFKNPCYPTVDVNQKHVVNQSTCGDGCIRS